MSYELCLFGFEIESIVQRCFPYQSCYSAIITLCSLFFHSNLQGANLFLFPKFSKRSPSERGARVQHGALGSKQGHESGGQRPSLLIVQHGLQLGIQSQETILTLIHWQ